MSADDQIKNVMVTVSDTDLKQLSGGRSRRRRRVRSEEPTETVGGGELLPASQHEPAVAVAVVKHAPAPAPAAPAPAPAAPAPAAPLPVNIKPKSILPAVSGVKILPKKRTPGAVEHPAVTQTRKKPKLQIPIINAASIVEKSHPRAGAAIASFGENEKSTPKPPASAAAPSAGKTRKFRERKISIIVKPAASTRKFRRTVKARAARMPIATVRRILLRKGVLKPKADGSIPDMPEEMLRSMLRDYMLLHATA